MLIYGNRVYIRAIEKADLKELWEMINDKEIDRTSGGEGYPISMFEQEKWYENNILKEDFHKYIIGTEEDGVIGLVNMNNIDWKHRSVCVGLKLSNRKNIKSVGVGVDAYLAMLRYVFDEMQMKTSWGWTLEDNIASLHMQKLCGGKEVGKRTNAIFKEGKYHNLILTEVLKEDYYELVKREKYWE